MSNKFLSRGKREDTGKWVTGYYVELPEDQRGKNFCLIIGFDGQYNRIIPETAGRGTGLTDKNGTRIFEGDILKLKDYHGERIVYIFWGHCGSWFYGGDGYSDEYIFNSSEREIIGNIYDNPELIGGTK